MIPNDILFSVLSIQVLSYQQVNMNKSAMKMKFGNKEVYWEMGESLLRKLETEGIIKEVFPLHGRMSLMADKGRCDRVHLL